MVSYFNLNINSAFRVGELFTFDEQSLGNPWKSPINKVKGNIRQKNIFNFHKLHSKYISYSMNFQMAISPLLNEEK